MTPEQQRIAIAEACGWTGFNPDNIPDCLQYTAKAPSGKWGLIPDYLNDLNAMHEAENVLTDEQDSEYSESLELVVGARWGANNACDMKRLRSATAAQRAEAFLRTIGARKEARK